MAMVPSSDGFGNEIYQISQHEGFDPPLELYTEPECKGMMFINHGHPNTTRMGSATYVPQFSIPPIVTPPLELFDAAGRVFRLDLLEISMPGESIRYWIDENPLPELYVEGVDYIGELLRHSPNNNSAALESFQSTIPVDDMTATYPVPAQSQHQGFQEGILNIDQRNFEDRNWGPQRQIYEDLGSVFTIPPVYGLNKGVAAPGLGNSGKLSHYSSSTHSIRKSVANDCLALRSPNPNDFHYPTSPKLDHPNTLEKNKNSQSPTIPTVARPSRHSARGIWTPIGSTLVEDVSSQLTLPEPDQFAYEAAQARLRNALLRTSTRAGEQQGVGVRDTSGSAAAADNTPAKSNGEQEQQGRAVARGRPRGTTARRGRGSRGGRGGGAQHVPLQNAKAASRSRGTTARRGRGGRAGRGGDAQHGPLQNAKVERTASE